MSLANTRAIPAQAKLTTKISCITDTWCGLRYCWKACIRQKLPKDETVAILSSGTYGVLSVIGDNGYPYGVPVNYVYRDGHIYLHAALSGHKVDAMRKNDKVSFTIVAKKNRLLKRNIQRIFEA